jgi:hypothetical protein
MDGHDHGHGLNGSGTVLERYWNGLSRYGHGHVTVTFSAKNERFTVEKNSFGSHVLIENKYLSANVKNGQKT